jgi:hypothetical protein
MDSDFRKKLILTVKQDTAKMCCKRSKTNESRACFLEFTAGRNTGNECELNLRQTLPPTHARTRMATLAFLQK